MVVKKTSRKATATRKTATRKVSRKTSSPKKSPSKKVSPKKSPSKAAPVEKVIDLSMYNEFEQQCIAKAQIIIQELKTKYRRDYKHMGALVASGYIKSAELNPDCKEFYDREHARRRALKESKRAAKGTKKCSPQKGGRLR